VPRKCLRGARLIDELPFGFEMLSGVPLLEVNFGLDDVRGFQVAGQDVNDEGFVVCLDCGRVRPEDPNKEIQHAPTCRTRRNQAGRTESVYLYRKIESEAIRLLLPVAQLDLETQRASFRAALQFGLRMRFGGRAPHLQTKVMQEPAGEGHRNYLVLFDSVPGGTGFLADLWRRDALMDVLQNTLDGLQACSCVRSGRDGCYRCLFAYQAQRDLEQTSSKVAQEMLLRILGKREALRDIDTLSDVTIDSKLESELEVRFLRAILNRAKHSGEVRSFLTDGEKRWEVILGSSRWEIVPQATLGPTDGVSSMCRPDFLFVPKATTMDQRSVAVFCDGFAYHVQPEAEVSRLGDDIEKRRAIMESPKHLVWSVTWDDVTEFEAGSQPIQQGLLSRRTGPIAAGVLDRWGMKRERELGVMTSADLLWQWLGQPDDEQWARRVVALGVEFTVDREGIAEADRAPLESTLRENASGVVPALSVLPVGPEATFMVNAHSDPHACLLGSIPTRSLADQTPVGPAWILRLYDDKDSRNEGSFRQSWRSFLQAFNLLQFSSRLEVVSSEGIRLQGVHYPAGHQAGAQEQEVEAADLPRQDALAGLGLLPEEMELARAVVESGGEVPVAGYELEDSRGRCVAEANLAWPGKRLVVLWNASPEEVAAFQQADWRTLDGDTDRDEILGAVIEGNDG
jgi:DEAD/DEAH box helicase domain-containing protein